MKILLCLLVVVVVMAFFWKRILLLPAVVMLGIVLDGNYILYSPARQSTTVTRMNESPSRYRRIGLTAMVGMILASHA